MGVCRYTPNAAVNGDMGWDKPIIKQWSSVINNWIRIKKMDEGRINKKVYNWAVLNKGPSCIYNMSGFINPDGKISISTIIIDDSDSDGDIQPGQSTKAPVSKGKRPRIQGKEKKSQG